MAQHRAWQVDIDNKIRHKRAAMAVRSYTLYLESFTLHPKP